MAYISSRKRALRPLSGSTFSAPAATLIAGLTLATPFAHGQTTSQTLPTVNVQTSDDAGGTDYKADRVASPKFTQPIVDTPQTISVIKEEVLKEQSASTLTEALRNVPGVGTFNIGENGRMNTGDAVSMRGFDSANSIFVDGIRDLGSISRDVFNTEQIEVIKGPSGSDYGRTAASGSINMVSKQPKLEDSFGASLGVGSGSYKRSTIDWNKNLSGIESGAAFRVNVVGENSGVAGRDSVKNKKWGIAPSFAIGLNTDTRVFFDYLHIKQNNTPDGGVSTAGLSGYNSAVTNAAVKAYINSHAVDSSNFYGTNGDYDDATADMATVRVEHDFSSETKLRNTTRWGLQSHKYVATAVMAPVATYSGSPDGVTVARTGNTGDSTNKILTNQTNLSTKFKTGSIEHDLSTGLELTRETMDTLGWTATVPNTSLYHPDSSLASTVTRTATGDTQSTLDSYAIYAFDTLKLNEAWQVSAGARLEHYSLSGSYWNNVGSRTAPNYVFTTDDASGNLFSWKLGAVYKPATNGSIYLNYAIQQQPPGTVTGGDGIGNANAFAASTSTSSNNNLSYDPQKTRTIELGTKWDLLDRRLLMTAAIFHTELSNEIEQDAVTGQYYQNGKKTVKGLELGAVGQITPLWQVTAGYTYQDTHTDPLTQTQTGTVSQDGSADLPFTPKHAFTTWTTYKLPYGFTVGGGARYMGTMKKSKDGSTVGPDSIPSYWVWDAMVGYQATKNLNLSLNIFNLFDKDYVAAINRGGHRYYPGVERSFRLTANLAF